MFYKLDYILQEIRASLFNNKPLSIIRLGDVGFKNGEHLVIYNSLKDLKNKIKYYLKNEKEREGIAQNGMKLVREKHSNEVRIQEMTEIIKKFLR